LILLAKSAPAAIHVKYVSSENVYLDAGSADSLIVGDRLSIGEIDTARIAIVEVTYVSEHSALCTIIELKGAIEIGAPAFIIPRILGEQSPQTPPVAQDTSASVSSIAEKKTAVPVKPAFAELSGSVAMQVHYWNDTNSSNLDFTQPTARLNLRAKRLWGSDVTLTIRSTTRHDERSRQYNSAVPRSEWRNRIYQLSLGYFSDESSLSFEIGRIISSKLSGVGYIDGLMVQNRFSNQITVGSFAGTQPQWQYSRWQSSLQKYGLFTGYSKGNYRNTRYEATVALAGEYHGSTPSREFCYIQNSLNISDSWSAFQSAEIDLNRGWKKDRTGKNLSLTNFYFSARHRIIRPISVGISYDVRKNYMTYELRSVADSLFDENLRQGLRGDISFRLPDGYLFVAGFGLQKKSTDSKPTYSYSAGLNKRDFLFPRCLLNLRGAGFTNPLTSGVDLGASFGRYVRQADLISIRLRTYMYSIKRSNIGRSNHSIQLNSQIELISPLYFSGLYEYSTGDDASGHRFVVELGYRF